MEPGNDDPLLQQLRALPPRTLTPLRRKTSLERAEKVFRDGNSPAWRLPELGLSAVLALAGLLYTAESVVKVSRIYGHAEVASVDTAR